MNLVGNDLLLMAIWLLIWPNATNDEIAAFIFNNGGELYSREVISEWMKDMKITKKKAFTEAYQAMTPINIKKAKWFWSKPPSLGIISIWIYQLIDFDEFGIGMEQVETSNGRSHCSIRVRRIGHYMHGAKLSIIMAIEPGDLHIAPHLDGSRERPHCWFWIRKVTGTTALDTANFLNQILTQLEQHPAPSGVNNHRVILCDNLNSHKVLIVTDTVEQRPTQNLFEMVYHPSYQLKYSPIEYIFSEIGGQLQKMVQPKWTNDNLQDAIETVASNIGMDGKFHNTFIHCGYGL